MNTNKDEARILSEEEVGYLTRALKKFLRTEFPDISSELVNTAEDTVRLQSLSSKCRQVRESQNMTIKDVSTKLKVPQYRLKAIEKGHSSEIDHTVFKKYSDFLDIEQWVNGWCKYNRKLANKLKIV